MATKCTKLFCFILFFICSEFNAQLLNTRPTIKNNILSQKSYSIGNTCSQAITICGDYTLSIMNPNSSGQVATRFGSAPQRDVWLKFTVAQSGFLAWTAASTVTTTEFDWMLWNITAGCPGSAVCCNYNYAGGSISGFGMQAVTGNSPCNNSAFTSDPIKEFSPPINVNTGETYAIQISNYDNTSAGFSISFINSTFVFGCATGIINTQPNTIISVFPNPAINEININSSVELQKVELYDVSGQLLLVEKTKENLHSISLANFSSGVCFLKLYNDNQLIKNEKLIILK